MVSARHAARVQPLLHGQREIRAEAIGLRTESPSSDQYCCPLFTPRNPHTRRGWLTRGGRDGPSDDNPVDPRGRSVGETLNTRRRRVGSRATSNHTSERSGSRPFWRDRRSEMPTVAVIRSRTEVHSGSSNCMTRAFHRSHRSHPRIRGRSARPSAGRVQGELHLPGPDCVDRSLPSDRPRAADEPQALFTAAARWTGYVSLLGSGHSAFGGRVVCAEPGYSTRKTSSARDRGGMYGCHRPWCVGSGRRYAQDPVHLSSSNGSFYPTRTSDSVASVKPAFYMGAVASPPRLLRLRGIQAAAAGNPHSVPSATSSAVHGTWCYCGPGFKTKAPTTPAATSRTAIPWLTIEADIIKQNLLDNAGSCAQFGKTKRPCTPSSISASSTDRYRSRTATWAARAD